MADAEAEKEAERVWTPPRPLPVDPQEAATAAINFIQGMPKNLGHSGPDTILDLWGCLVDAYNRCLTPQSAVPETDAGSTLLKPTFEQLLLQLPTLVPWIINSEAAVQFARHIATACEITRTLLADEAYTPVFDLAPGEPRGLLFSGDRSDGTLRMPIPSWIDIITMFSGEPGATKLKEMLSLAEIDEAINYYADALPTIARRMVAGLSWLGTRASMTSEQRAGLAKEMALAYLASLPSLAPGPGQEEQVIWGSVPQALVEVGPPSGTVLLSSTLFGPREPEVTRLVNALMSTGRGVAAIDVPKLLAGVEVVIGELTGGYSEELQERLDSALQQRMGAAVVATQRDLSGTMSLDWQLFKMAARVVDLAARPRLWQALPAGPPGAGPPEAAGALALLRMTVWEIWARELSGRTALPDLMHGLIIARSRADHCRCPLCGISGR